MARLKVLFSTFREQTHQATALEAAPADVHVEICSRPGAGVLASRLSGFDVLVTERLGLVDAEAIAAATSLKLIQRLGRMTHDIDTAAARQAGIPVCNLPLRNCAMVAEHALMQVLALAKCFRECENAVRVPGAHDLPPRKCDGNYFAINWTDRQNVRSVAGSTVGIVGFGEIGCELAMRLNSFDCEVLYNKRARLPATVEEQFGVRYADIDAIRAESDFLCLLLPHFSDAQPAVGSDFIAGMKDGACLISVGSSSTLNETDVADAYRRGKLSGVATDGWSWEPLLPDNPLLKLADDPAANVAFTPHSALGAMTKASINLNRKREWQNVERLLKGEPLLNRVA